MEIYKYIADSETYESLETSLEYRDVMHSLGDCKPLAQSWKPVAVQASWRLGHRGDFPCLRSYAPVFSSRAWDVLRPLIEKSVELLPIIYPPRNYSLINVLEVINCLDPVRTELDVNDISGNVTAIHKRAFRDDLVIDKHIFKTPQTRHLEVLVSDKFKLLVKENDLKGLRFERLG